LQVGNHVSIRVERRSKIPQMNIWEERRTLEGGFRTFRGDLVASMPQGEFFAGLN